ncbi:MAG: IS200/IS605 family element transposase accessory protein TnpB [Firmicutes bacterium]|nr:IS200/IS605 family element transposase accessory protein TnpB [Bacillota bacterium]
MTKGYKYRIYPNSAQIEYMNSIFDSCRFVYNHFLAERKEVWEKQKRSMSYTDTSRLLTILKKDPGYVWLSSCDSMALQESLKDLDRAYKSFFAKRGRYPHFKSKRDHRRSYRTRNVNNCIRIEDKRLILPKVGRVKIKLSRGFKGRILNATVSKTATGKYYVSLCVEEELIPKPNAGGIIAIDVGISEFYSDSNGYKLENPVPLRKHEKKLSREQRRLSRKVKGSKNYEKQRIKVAKVHEKIYSVRTDFLHKESTKLVSDNQVIGIETLNVKGMIRNHHLAKSIQDASWNRFLEMLKYKSLEYGCSIEPMPRFYASSQVCSYCGYKNIKVKDLSVRSWVCPVCGISHDRDVNAAVNILNKTMMLISTSW